MSVVYNKTLSALVYDVILVKEKSQENYARILVDSVNDFSQKIEFFIENLENSKN